MDIQITEGNPHIVHLSGKLTCQDNDAFSSVLNVINRGHGNAIVMDLSGLDYLDSFGIGLFLVARDEARQHGNTLSFRKLKEPVRRIFTLANLSGILTVEDQEVSPPPAGASRPPRVGTAARGALHVSPCRETSPETAVIELSGRFTFTDRDAFETLLKTIESSPHRSLTLNLSRLDFMDSAGLSMLLIVRDEAAKRGKECALASPSGRVAHLLRLAAIDCLMPIHRDA
jgi:anti-anti-sigma factor